MPLKPNTHEKWMYLLKHMSTLDEIPKFLDKRIFQLIFNISEVANLRKEERMAYEASLKSRWDTQNAFDSVRREALIKGAEQKSYNVVANLIQQLGFDDEAAAGVAEVSVDFVRKVRADLSKKER